MATTPKANVKATSLVMKKDRVTKNYLVVVHKDGSPYIAKIYIPNEAIKVLGDHEEYTVTITPA